MKYMKRQVFPIIGTIITKGNSVALWEVVFDEVLGCTSADLTAMWALGLAL